MGANNADFFDGGNNARLNQYGAPQETEELDGPRAPSQSGAENRFAGYTAGKVAGSGSYS
jgi:hypothetical protein